MAATISARLEIPEFLLRHFFMKKTLFEKNVWCEMYFDTYRKHGWLFLVRTEYFFNIIGNIKYGSTLRCVRVNVCITNNKADVIYEYISDHDLDLYFNVEYWNDPNRAKHQK